MFKRLLKWLKGMDYDKQEKGRLCAPCAEPCGEDLCRKVGCLNMDMRTNALRLKLLVKRLEEYGYEFPTEELKKGRIDLSKCTDQEIKQLNAMFNASNIVHLKDYQDLD